MKAILTIFFLFSFCVSFSQSDTTLTNITVDISVKNILSYKVRDSVLYVEFPCKEYSDSILVSSETYFEVRDLRLPENDVYLKDFLSKKITDDLDALAEEKKKKLSKKIKK